MIKELAKGRNKLNKRRKRKREALEFQVDIRCIVDRLFQIKTKIKY